MHPEATSAAPARVILLRSDSPPKPEIGASCNGCGVCCAAEPCPLGALISKRLSGSCAALTFEEASGRYLCGAAADPARWLPWVPAVWASRLVHRWIAAGQGCDSDLLPAAAAEGRPAPAEPGV